VVLCAGGEHEREAESVRRLRGGGDPVRRVTRLVQEAVRVVVLDRAADCACLGDARDRTCAARRIGAVAVLEIDRDRKLRRAVEHGGVLDHLVERHAAVEPAEREGEAGARRRERPEAEGGQHPRGAGVPRVRDHERLTGVERRERSRFLSLGGHGDILAETGALLRPFFASATSGRLTEL
jgi:hypothetical protein